MIEISEIVILSSILLYLMYNGYEILQVIERSKERNIQFKLQLINKYDKLLSDGLISVDDYRKELNKLRG